ncbi:MAG: Sir2 family NAD-dependent protein deacetylase [Actinomycetota bacterium]|nr:Sir2 family NAD-dependent protein deacetylase [Actinomycetota bacterium]
MIERAVEVLSGRKRILVFTGAGISTESGIPDFRGPQGIWKRFDPADYTYDRYITDPGFRRESWGKRFRSPYLDASPNYAHHAVTRLWESGHLVGCVTQNVDGLHIASGLAPEALVELHGSANRIHCISCGDEPEFDEIEQRWESGEEDPPCHRCNGILKTTIVYFGEDLPMDATRRAWDMAEQADAVLVIGSSLSVYPAAFVPLDVVDRGHPMVIINRGKTDHDFRAAVLVDGTAGEIVPTLVDRLTGSE